MTFREKLQMEHPECVDEVWGGGCKQCPFSYGYEAFDNKPCKSTELATKEFCTWCWNREMPSTELVKTVTLPMPPSTELKPEIDASDYIDIYTKGHGKGYDEGLNDAWELARKIHAMEYGDFTEVFDRTGYDGREVKISVINELSPQEALAKLKAYEDSKIEVGDVVTYAGDKGVVLDKRGNKIVVLSDDCWVSEWYECDVEKTGKHIDIKSILEQIGE